MKVRDTSTDVEIEVSLDEKRAVIRCTRCGVEQVLWTRGDLAMDEFAALFTEEHLSCTPQPRSPTD
jgi:hypothetical protein